MNNNSLQLVLATVVALTASNGASAEDSRGFYTGAGAGFSETLNVDNFTFPETDDPVTAFGGFRFNEQFGVEGFYADFKPDSLVTRNEGNIYTRSYQGANLRADSNSTVAGLSAVARLQDEGPFKPFARAGLHYYDLEGVAASGDSLLLGAGADVKLPRGWNARIEWERYADVDRSDRDVFSAHFRYHFQP